MSWTTDRRVAEFFARRRPDGVVAQVRLQDAVWLETAESEIVSRWAWNHEAHDDTGTLPAWNEVKPVPPDLKSARRYR